MSRPMLTLEWLSFLEKEDQVGYRYGQDSASQEVNGLSGVHSP
jgi:hypothetical protein